MGEVDTSSDEIVDNWLPSVERSKEMDTALSDVRVVPFDHVMVCFLYLDHMFSGLEVVPSA